MSRPGTNDSPAPQGDESRHDLLARINEREREIERALEEAHEAAPAAVAEARRRAAETVEARRAEADRLAAAAGEEIVWDGGLLPARPAGFEEGRRLGNEDGGILLVGDEGSILAGCYGESPRLVPESRMRRYRVPKRTIERIPDGPDGHEQDWIRACKGGQPASSSFDYSGPLSETILMGNLAVRFPDKELLWNGEAMEITNDPDANAYVNTYREGWKL